MVSDIVWYVYTSTLARFFIAALLIILQYLHLSSAKSFKFDSTSSVLSHKNTNMQGGWSTVACGLQVRLLLTVTQQPP